MSFAECICTTCPPTFYKTTSSVTFTTDILLYNASFPGFLSLAVKKRQKAGWDIDQGIKSINQILFMCHLWIYVDLPL